MKQPRNEKQATHKCCILQPEQFPGNIEHQTTRQKSQHDIQNGAGNPFNQMLALHQIEKSALGDNGKEKPTHKHSVIMKGQKLLGIQMKFHDVLQKKIKKREVMKVL